MPTTAKPAKPAKSAKSARSASAAPRDESPATPSYPERETRALALWVALTRAQDAVAQHSVADIERHGITAGEFGILELIYHKGPMLLGDVQKRVLAKPQAVLCVWALAADTEAEAWQHFSGRERWKIDRNRGALGPLASPAEVALRAYTGTEQLEADKLRRTALVGSGQQVAEKLRALADTLEVSEVVVITWTHDPAARRRSYELLAREFL